MADDDGGGSGAEKQKTQRRILELLKRRGPVDSGELARELALTTMAIRLHLYELFERGHVSSSDVRRSRGRPVKVWALTERAAQFFPDRHGELISKFLNTARTALGESALNSIIDARASEQLSVYRVALDVCTSLEAKVERLARIRSEEGYMAESHTDDDGILKLIENHCPICSAARTCPQFCGAELDVFRAALGPSVEVTRCEHILAGERRCVYEIRPRPETVIADPSSHQQ